MKNRVRLLVFLAAYCASLAAQNYTSVTITRIQDAAGNLLTAPQGLCVVPTDNRDRIAPYTAGGGGSITITPVCYDITAGVVTGMSLATPDNTTPSGANYRFTITDPNGTTTVCKNVTWSGSTFNFDTFACNQATLPTTGGTFTGNYTFTGNIAINGTVKLDNYFDLKLISPPANPSSGYIRLFGKTATGNPACLTSVGVDCWPAGGGVIGPGTAGKLAKFATSTTLGDSIISESGTVATVAGTVTANGFTGNVTGAVTGNASTATALAANPTDCAAGQYATTIDAGGNLTCAAVQFSQIGGTATAAQLPATAVNSVVNDTNVTGSIATQTLTLGWTGTLAKARQNAATAYTDAVNAFTAEQSITGSANNVNVLKMKRFTDTSPTGNFIDLRNAADAASLFTIDVTGTVTVGTVPVARVTGLAAIATSGSATDLTAGTVPAARMPALTGDVTTSAGAVATTVVNLPDGVTQAGHLLATNIAAPTSPTAGKVKLFTDSTDLRFHDKNSAGTIGTTVVADTGAANNFLTAISAAGVISKAQPTYSNIGAGTVTNMTMDGEATGNTITLPSKIWLPAASCNGSTANLIWDSPSSTPAVAACVTGTNTQKGVADFADTTGGFSVQMTELLPADFTGNIDAKIVWLTTATTGNVKWSLSSVCTATDGTETDDAAFNTASTVTTAAPAVASRITSSTITSLTITGCAAGELLHLKLFRDGNDASDTIAATARFYGLELTIRRAM